MIDLKAAYSEFSWLKNSSLRRNDEYFLLRQAVKGNFRWPRDWPKHIPRLTYNVCKPITERFTTYLMGKGFSWNLERPNSLEHRESAERAEKILKQLLILSKAELQFNMAAKTGSQLGRSIFKVYKKGKPGAEHACFNYAQPDYFYGIASSDDHLADFSTVYYSYPLDILEARRLFGPGDYKTEDETDRAAQYEPLRERLARDGEYRDRQRRVPVLEVWTKDEYALVVGGVVKFNGENPYRWSSTGDGFIPFVVIENIRNGGEAEGESDIGQARELNEQLNYVISRKAHVVNRWLNPTLVWEGAPQNYAETLAATMSGGGAIPARLGGRLSFLTYDRPNPAVAEMQNELRQAILESAGMNDVALQGITTGSVNTGPALAAQFQPVLSTVEKKRMEWTQGLKSLFAMLLQVQEGIGASKALGSAVVNQRAQSERNPGGQVVTLSGKDIAGLRDITVSWPGVLPKDDADSSRLEMEKAAQGFQSIYTTLEKLGAEYPDDEIARIRMENQDPSLRGEKVAEQIRAQTPMLKQQAQQQFEAEQAAMQAEQQGAQGAPEEDPFAALGGGEAGGFEEQGLGAKLRELAGRKASLDESGDELAVANPQAGY